MLPTAFESDHDAPVPRMKCPRDGSDMQLQAYWKHPRHVCDSCHGQLLGERDVMEALGHAESSTFATIAKIRVAQLPSSALRCPRDGTTMHILVYEGIELDICPACRALWLDHGEHDKIRALKKERANLDVDAETATDGIDGVLDFVGESVGSLFDGLL